MFWLLIRYPQDGHAKKIAAICDLSPLCKTIFSCFDQMRTKWQCLILIRWQHEDWLAMGRFWALVTIVLQTHWVYLQFEVSALAPACFLYADPPHVVWAPWVTSGWRHMIGTHTPYSPQTRELYTLGTCQNIWKYKVFYVNEFPDKWGMRLNGDEWRSVSDIRVTSHDQHSYTVLSSDSWTLHSRNVSKHLKIQVFLYEWMNSSVKNSYRQPGRPRLPVLGLLDLHLEACSPDGRPKNQWVTSGWHHMIHTHTQYPPQTRELYTLGMCQNIWKYKVFYMNEFPWLMTNGTKLEIKWVGPKWGTWLVLTNCMVESRLLSRFITHFPIDN